MRKIILYAGMGIFLILFLLMYVTIHFRDTRESELELGLSEALEGTIYALCEDNTYDISDKDVFVGDLLQRLLVTLNSSSEVEVNILCADEEKGLLRVEAVQSYQHVNGKKGTVSSERTVLFDRSMEEEEEICHVYLYLTRKDMEQEDGSHQSCYKQYEVRKGEVIVLNEPQGKKVFECWKLSDMTQMPMEVKVGGDIIAYAFEE